MDAIRCVLEAHRTAGSFEKYGTTGGSPRWPNVAPPVERHEAAGDGPKRRQETNGTDRSRRKSDGQKYRVTKTSKLHGQRISFVIKKALRRECADCGASLSLRTSMGCKRPSSTWMNTRRNEIPRRRKIDNQEEFKAIVKTSKSNQITNHEVILPLHPILFLGRLL